MSEYLLAIESTCDETAVAIVDRQGNVVADVIASQESLHQQFAGVVPEIAARAHLESMLPCLKQVLDRSGISPEELSLIAVANEPGLAGSLLIGVSAAKALALAWQKPLVGINHIQAHIYACQIAARSSSQVGSNCATPDSKVESIYPCIGFVISGGHTNLYRCQHSLDFHYLGGTIDDAAGEAFDKVGMMMGLDFPGGAALSKLAEEGDPTAYPFPRPMLKEKEQLRLSFSGLKTSVRYTLFGNGADSITGDYQPNVCLPDVAASFQAAVIDCLVGKALLATKLHSIQSIALGGGVLANRRLRNAFEEACDRHCIQLHIAPLDLCTDNAVMGALAWEKFDAGFIDGLDLAVNPGLRRS